MKSVLCKLFLSITVLAILAGSIPFAQAPETIACRDSLIRIHIRAHDDSPASQEVKLRVRDALNEVLAPEMRQCETLDAARTTLRALLPQLQNIAEGVCGMPVSCTLSREDFPDRYYADIRYPAGEYEALIVRLGAGEGANWWCVAFPPLCYSAVENASSSPSRITYRSFFAELWHRIFG